MFIGVGEGATVAVMVMVEAGMVIVVVAVVVDAGGGGIVFAVGGIVIVVVEVQLVCVMIDNAVHCDLPDEAVVEVILGEVAMVVVGEALAEVVGEVLAEVVGEVVDDIDKAQEQAELILEVDDLQSAKNVGMPVVAVTVEARYGVQNADAWEGDAFKLRRHLSILLHRALASLRKS